MNHYTIKNYGVHDGLSPSTAGTESLGLVQFVERFSIPIHFSIPTLIHPIQEELPFGIQGTVELPDRNGSDVGHLVQISTLLIQNLGDYQNVDEQLVNRSLRLGFPTEFFFPVYASPERENEGYKLATLGLYVNDGLKILAPANVRHSTQVLRAACDNFGLKYPRGISLLTPWAYINEIKPNKG